MKASELIGKFQYALDNQWGYIYATAGDLWTESKQKQKVTYMVNKYGTNWQKNSEAKEDNYYRSALYGEKWIGHYVADCSGLFSWAFKKLGGYIPHGSNSIWKGYCTVSGNLSSGKRTDGNALKPGTAVFTDRNGDKTHIGLFIGGTKVIEASGVDAGVCVSNISATKWKCWGELKNVNYTDDDNSGFPSESVWRATIRKGSKGAEVTEAQKMLYKLGYDLGKWGIDGDFGSATQAAVKEFQKDHKLAADGVIGPLTWDELEKAYKQVDGQTEDRPKYTVTIPHLTKEQVDALRSNYPDSTVTEE